MLAPGYAGSVNILMLEIYTVRYAPELCNVSVGIVTYWTVG